MHGMCTLYVYQIRIADSENKYIKILQKKKNIHSYSRRITS